MVIQILARLPKMSETIRQQLERVRLHQLEMRTAAEQAAARLRMKRGLVRGKLPTPPPRPSIAKTLPTSFDAALRGMVDWPFLKSQKWQEQQWRSNREGAHWHILDFERLFIRQCFKMGIPMFAHSLVRTHAEQTMLYVKGVSKAKAGQSWHNFGQAVDIVHSVKAWNLTDHEWRLLGHIGKEVAARNNIKVRWGGDWSFYDPAHWELEERAKVGFPFPPKPKGARVGAAPPTTL
jgi:hypothetical protein